MTRPNYNTTVVYHTRISYYIGIRVFHRESLFTLIHDPINGKPDIIVYFISIKRVLMLNVNAQISAYALHDASGNIFDYTSLPEHRSIYGLNNE